MAQQASIILQQLHIGYGRTTVARGLSASLYRGELTCMLGANGIGKSTLLRTLASFQPPLAGDVTIEGRQLAELTQKELSKLCSVVLTGRPDVQNITAAELVGIARSPYTGFWGTLSANDLRIVDEALGMVGIGSLRHRKIQTLSDGECQKVMIAKALAQQTPIILLDEPTAFLDYPSKVEVLLLLKRLAHDTNKTIFLTTHDVEMALQTADRLWILDRHGSLSVGTPRELAASGSIGRYLQRADVAFDPSSLTIKIGSHE